MKKVNAIFEGVIFLWVILIVFTILLSMCLSGMCTSEWVFSNVVMSSIAEIVLFVSIVVKIQKGAFEILRKTKNLLIVKALYKKVLYLSILIALYGLITFLYSSRMFNHFAYISVNESNAALIYLVNVLVVVLMIFSWMCVEIHKINRKMRF